MDLRGVDPLLTVAPTEILTLGSTHLSAYRDTLTPAHLDDLRARLIAYAPDVIAVENVPGPTCELLLAHPAAYARAGDGYCYDVTPFRTESGLSMDSAMAVVRGRLAHLDTVPAAAVPAPERRALAAAFLAANDRYSAVVQWLRLRDDERRAGDGLGEASVAHLRELSASINESTQLGARVAARLGLERVYPVDDHSADALYADVGDDFSAELRAVWSATSPAKDSMRARYDRLDAGIAAPGGVLALYRAFNTPDMQRAFADNDFRLLMNDARAHGYGRRYVAWWQTRNLRMVASLVAAGADAPGGKVLAIVGASHKPYYDAYLDQMHDVRLGDAGALLE